eukprot:5491769-Prymnesium_polylepis.1
MTQCGRCGGHRRAPPPAQPLGAAVVLSAHARSPAPGSAECAFAQGRVGQHTVPGDGRHSTRGGADRENHRREARRRAPADQQRGDQRAPTRCA